MEKKKVIRHEKNYWGSNKKIKIIYKIKFMLNKIIKNQEPW